jgi:hypothetical protein
MHAIATFNALAAEGRRVCAGLISRSPVSRDDASMYTPDWAPRASEADVRLQAALRRDPYDGSGDQRLLGDGAAAAEAAEAAAQREAEAAAAAAGGAPPPPDRRSRYERAAAAAEARFGYPGAVDAVQPDDVSLALTEAERQERAWRRAASGGGGAGRRGGGGGLRRSSDDAAAEEAARKRGGGGSGSGR